MNSKRKKITSKVHLSDTFGPLLVASHFSLSWFFPSQNINWQMVHLQIKHSFLCSSPLPLTQLGTAGKEMSSKCNPQSVKPLWESHKWQGGNDYCKCKKMQGTSKLILWREIPAIQRTGLVAFTFLQAREGCSLEDFNKNSGETFKGKESWEAAQSCLSPGLITDSSLCMSKELSTLRASRPRTPHHCGSPIAKAQISSADMMKHFYQNQMTWN